MNIKKHILNLYYIFQLSGEKANWYQRNIRNIEWNAVKCHIKRGMKFLDVGCGAGYNIRKAIDEFDCICKGVDPDPGAHGVGRNNDKSTENLDIIKGVAENLPFTDQSFDIVFSSHTLEHVNDEQKSLREMKRVLNDNGILIIGMPTATMAWISLITQLFFTTHIRFVNVFMKPFIKTGKQKFIHLFLPPSHSDFNKTVVYDIKNYSINSWTNIIADEFNIIKTILPAVYPFPDYIQIFKPFKSSKTGSSVFFICSKKNDNPC